MQNSKPVTNAKVFWSISLKAGLFCALLSFVFMPSFARKIYSAGNANWTSTGAWVGGVVPVANDTVIIQNGHTISVSSNLYSNSTYMFLIILGTLDLTSNGKISLSSTSNIIIETGAQILGNGNSDQISIGSGSPEYSGGQGTITGPSYVNNGHTPTSGEGTGGCGCYNSVGSCTITSTDGYQVHINVWATQILVETSPCTYGYNYDVRLNYNVTFSGTNIPSSLNTLQGYVYCGSTSLFFDLPNNGGSGTVDTGGNGWRSTADCGTATPQSLSCLNARIEIGGSGIASNTSCTSALPIKLLNFEANSVAQGAKLSWTTSMEKNFDYFQIERAGQNLMFAPIAQIPGKGGLEINVSYNYVDSELSTGKNYYRLKSVDIDGSFEYSKVVFVNWSNSRGIRVYPNPIADHTFTIELNDKIVAPARMRVTDQVGQTVYEEDLSKTTSEIQLPKSLNAGLYHLRLSSNQGNEIIKVVIP